MVPQLGGYRSYCGLMIKAETECIQFHADPDINELWVDPDIMVLASPEIAELPNWVVGLVAAGGLQQLSLQPPDPCSFLRPPSRTICSTHDDPTMKEKTELIIARVTVFFTVMIAGYFGINPPGFVAQTVAFAFGLAAASFFPAILMGIFFKRMNKEGAIAGMIAGIVFTASYIIYFTFINPELTTQNIGGLEYHRRELVHWECF
jgi:cation/acetate symporter